MIIGIKRSTPIIEGLYDEVNNPSSIKNNPKENEMIGRNILPIKYDVFSDCVFNKLISSLILLRDSSKAVLSTPLSILYKGRFEITWEWYKHK
jgi:hypothetical protein